MAGKGMLSCTEQRVERVRSLNPGGVLVCGRCHSLCWNVSWCPAAISWLQPCTQLPCHHTFLPALPANSNPCQMVHPFGQPHPPVVDHHVCNG